MNSLLGSSFRPSSAWQPTHRRQASCRRPHLHEIHEQLAINQASTWTDGKEINWGAFVMSTIETGHVNTPNDQIDPSADIFFVNRQGGGSATNTVVNSRVPSSKGFSGFADSYASVDMSVQGLWSKQLDSDYFDSALGMLAARRRRA